MFGTGKPSLKFESNAGMYPSGAIKGVVFGFSVKVD
jgi:hypothetical protein